eukprot:gene17741-biopygen20402
MPAPQALGEAPEKQEPEKKWEGSGKLKPCIPVRHSKRGAIATPDIANRPCPGAWPPGPQSKSRHCHTPRNTSPPPHVPGINGHARVRSASGPRVTRNTQNMSAQQCGAEEQQNVAWGANPKLIPRTRARCAPCGPTMSGKLRPRRYSPPYVVVGWRSEPGCQPSQRGGWLPLEAEPAMLWAALAGTGEVYRLLRPRAQPTGCSPRPASRPCQPAALLVGWPAVGQSVGIVGKSLGRAGYEPVRRAACGVGVGSGV